MSTDETPTPEQGEQSPRDEALVEIASLMVDRNLEASGKSFDETQKAQVVENMTVALEGAVENLPIYVAMAEIGAESPIETENLKFLQIIDGKFESAVEIEVDEDGKPFALVGMHTEDSFIVSQRGIFYLGKSNTSQDLDELNVPEMFKNIDSGNVREGSQGWKSVERKKVGLSPIHAGTHFSYRMISLSDEFNLKNLKSTLEKKEEYESKQAKLAAESSENNTAASAAKIFA